MTNIRPNIIPQRGWITLCSYCGEQVGNSTKYCPLYKKQSGRKEIFEANVAILNERRKANLPVPDGFKNWI